MMIKGMPFGVEQQPCPYIEGRTFYSEIVYIPELDEEGMDSLLEIGFRHFGAHFFRPVCDDCGRCIPLRVPSGRFRFSRNRRRVLNRAKELSVELKDPVPDREKYELYLQHGERFAVGGTDSYEGFAESFFTHAPHGKVLEVRREGKLVAAGHLDMTDKSMSAVYCYWDPAESNLSLGTFAVLKEIELAVSRNIPYLYLGYYIKENRHMNYKASFYPNEALIQEGKWLPFYDEERNIVSSRVLEHGFLPVLRLEKELSP